MTKRTAVIAFALVIAACGGATEGGETTEATPAGTETTVPTPTTTEAPPTTVAPTTTTTAAPAGVYASLSDEQRTVVDQVCQAAINEGTIWETTFYEVVTGYSGVPELEDALAEVTRVEDGMTMIPTSEERATAAELAAPICNQIGWEASAVAAPTTAAPVAVATVSVEIGELQLTGEVEGCPPAEVAAGEYWVGPNDDVEWQDTNGTPWSIDLSVDATSGDLLWSFSFTGGSPTHRLISYHENQSTFESDVSAESATFETIFNDSLASVSGGWPDTPGTITITCM